MKKQYITDINGKRIDVTDFKKALEQAEMFASYIPRKGYAYEEEASLYWKDLLEKLKKLK